MAGRTKLPDLGTLGALRRTHRRNADHPGLCRQGHTLAEIAIMYDCTVNGVYLRFARAGQSEPRARYADAIPWRVAREHENHYDLHMLRELAKQDAGLPLGPRGPRLGPWLEELDNQGKVVAYTRERGFYRVKRREVDGSGYIRKPVKRCSRTATR